MIHGINKPEWSELVVLGVSVKLTGRFVALLRKPSRKS